MSGVPCLREISNVSVEESLETTILLPDDDDVAKRFATVLTAARGERAIRTDQTLLYAGDGDAGLVAPSDSRLWVPHIIAMCGTPRIVWECSPVNLLEEALGASIRHISLWSRQPEALIRLAEVTAARALYPDGTYLSLRWALAHPGIVAAALAGNTSVEFDHVSVHVHPDELEDVCSLLVNALGLAEIPRPQTIAIPGRWFATASAKVHLNARETRSEREAGSAPNHVCFAVEDPSAVEQAVRAHGYACERSGSLGLQIWFRLQSGTVVELQPLGGRL